MELKTLIRQFLNVQIEALFPSGCACCERPLIKAFEIERGICTECAENYTIDCGILRCEICGQPLISEIGVCTQCRQQNERSFEKVITLYPYSGIGLKLLRQYKFSKKIKLAVFLAEKIIEARRIFFKELKDSAENPLVFVPVPPRPGKIKLEGFDQIESIARILEKQAALSRCLVRKAVKSQKKLNAAERAQNLKGKIFVKKNPPKRVLLFDDVYTTGATMEACAEVLKAAGAKEVFGLCLFKTM